MRTRVEGCAHRRPGREFSSPVGAEKGNDAVLVRSCSPSASGPLGPRPRLSARPLVALCCALMLLTAACGSRLSDEELASTNGGGGGSGAAATTPSAPSNAGVKKGPGGPKVGTLPLPCNKAAGGAPKAPAQADEGCQRRQHQDRRDLRQVRPGEGAHREHRGVDAGVRRLLQLLWRHQRPHAEADEDRLQAVPAARSHQAGVQRQGLRHRRQRVGDRQPGRSADARLRSHRGAGLHRHVGQGAVRQPGPADPEPVELLQHGPPKFIVKEHPDAVKKAALLYGDIATAADQAKRIQKAYEMEGFKFTYVKKTPVISEAYTSEVQDMKSKGVQYVTMVSALQRCRSSYATWTRRTSSPRSSISASSTTTPGFRRHRGPKARSCRSTRSRSNRSTTTRRSRPTRRRTRR